MNRILVVLALVLALVAAALGFDVITVSDDPHVLGWLALAVASYIAADLT